MKTNSSVSPGAGIDIGTMNIVAARQEGENIKTRRVRDAFIDVPKQAKRMLRISKADYVEKDGKIILIGDHAMTMAASFGKELRRPLSGGLVSAGEIDAVEVIGILVDKVLGKPVVKDEICFFSVPANPVDQPNRDNVYHEDVLKQILKELGYRPYPANEAMAVVYSETADDGFSGIGLSFGSGMTNIALAYQTVEALTFSVARGGDWIDAGAASSTQPTQEVICSIKEGGLDLTSPKTMEERAIAAYYKRLIEYCLVKISEKFDSIRGQFAFNQEIPIVVSGGTSLAGGFLEFFSEVFEEHRSRFPLKVSDIRQAEDPLNAVAYGMLIQAQQEYEDEEEEAAAAADEFLGSE